MLNVPTACECACALHGLVLSVQGMMERDVDLPGYAIGGLAGHLLLGFCAWLHWFVVILMTGRRRRKIDVLASCQQVHCRAPRSEAKILDGRRLSVRFSGVHGTRRGHV